MANQGQLLFSNFLIVSVFGGVSLLPEEKVTKQGRLTFSFNLWIARMNYIKLVISNTWFLDKSKLLILMELLHVSI